MNRFVRNIPTRANSRTVKLGLTLLLLSGTAAFAQTNNFVLENITNKSGKSTAVFPRIEVKGSNLSKDELTRLFSGAAPKEEAAQLAKKLQAESISIPEASVTAEEASATLQGFLATGVNAGKIASATLKGADGKGKSPGGDVVFHSNALTIEQWDVGNAINALNGAPMDGAGSASKLEWSGFNATFPDPEVKADAQGGNLVKVSLGSLSGSGVYENGVPGAGKAEAKNLVIDPGKATKIGQALNAFGYSKLTLGMTAAGNYNNKTKIYSVDDFTIKSAEAGALGLKMALANIEPQTFTATRDARLAGMMAGALANLSLRFDNSGLFEKSVEFMAKQQKKSPDALRKEWSAMVTQFLPLVLGGDPAGLKLASGLASFIATPKNLTISLKAKGDPVPLTQFQEMKEPAAFLGKFDVDAVAGK